MRIVIQIICVLLWAACFIGAFVFHNLLDMILFCTMMIVCTIGLAATSIVAAISQPRENRQNLHQQTSDANSWHGESEREEKEMLAEIKLNELMNPAPPKLPKTRRATDFDEIVMDAMSETRKT